MFRMRRLTICAAVIGTIAAGGASVALATGSDLGESAEPLASGNALVLGMGEQNGGSFSINAISHPTFLPPGLVGNATGGMIWQDSPTSLGVAKVTCVRLNTETNSEIVTGQIQLPVQQAGQFVVAEAMDNDAPGGTDQLRFSFQSGGGARPDIGPLCWKPVSGPVDISSGFLETVPANQ